MLKTLYVVECSCVVAGNVSGRVGPGGEESECYITEVILMGPTCLASSLG